MSLKRGECAEDLRGIIPVTGERHGQRGRHIQSKHSGINLHRAWILMPGQGLDDLLRLPVIKHVHDIAVPERVGRHRNRKVHPVSFSPFHCLLIWENWSNAVNRVRTERIEGALREF